MLDKGKAASVTAIVYTTDKRTGKVIFENQTTLVARGSGGFGGKRIGNGQLITTGGTTWYLEFYYGADRGAASAANTPPRRKPDAILEEKTLPSQAALYRCVCLTAFHIGSSFHHR